MENQIEFREGWWWPIYDHSCWKYLTKRKQVPANISAYAVNKKVVVQAGGNAGMYVKFYQDIFETVYTFEPDPINFYCLVKNTGNNVIKFQSCIGNTRGTVELSPISLKRANTGGFFVNGQGKIPILRIDDLGLDCCDLIHLDIEGFEGHALLGAQETIKKFHPIIAVELAEHGEKFDWPDAKIRELLLSYGYQEEAEVWGDFVFKFKE
jgi:FkbM family methyltransferase